MTNQRITFDIDSGTPYECNLVINGGADFNTIFTINQPNGSSLNIDGWTGSSQMTKSVSIGSTSYPNATFSVGIVSATDGKLKISLGSTQTRNLSEGRYVYDILVSSGSTIYKLVEGNVLVKPGISSSL